MDFSLSNDKIMSSAVLFTNQCFDTVGWFQEGHLACKRNQHQLSPSDFFWNKKTKTGTTGK